MAQTKAKSLMESYAALSAAERAEFDAMRAGFDMRSQAAKEAGKKAVETKRRRSSKPEASKAAEV